VPEDDRFMTIEELPPDNFLYGATYMGIARSDDLVLVQITVSNTRGLAQKKALFARIAERLAESPSLRPEDVFVNLLETLPENWSFGHGLAQYAQKAG
jgi:phenylpyruvate tautomerase PptA (4-oxalocrotonate tautomerase family)